MVKPLCAIGYFCKKNTLFFVSYIVYTENLKVDN